MRNMCARVQSIAIEVEAGTLDTVQFATDVTSMSLAELRQLGREAKKRTEGSDTTAWTDMLGVVRNEIQRILKSNGNGR